MLLDLIAVCYTVFVLPYCEVPDWKAIALCWKEACLTAPSGTPEERPLAPVVRYPNISYWEAEKLCASTQDQDMLHSLACGLQGLHASVQIAISRNPHTHPETLSRIDHCEHGLAECTASVCEQIRRHICDHPRVGAETLGYLFNLGYHNEVSNRIVYPKRTRDGWPDRSLTSTYWRTEDIRPYLDTEVMRGLVAKITTCHSALLVIGLALRRFEDSSLFLELLSRADTPTELLTQVALLDDSRDEVRKALIHNPKMLQEALQSLYISRYTTDAERIQIERHPNYERLVTESENPYR